MECITIAGEGVVSFEANYSDPILTRMRKLEASVEFRSDNCVLKNPAGISSNTDALGS